MKDGDIATYKGRIFLADNILSTILAYNKEFESIKKAYSDFKKEMDECTEDGCRYSIEGKKRIPLDNKPKSVIKNSSVLVREIDVSFIKLYD